MAIAAHESLEGSVVSLTLLAGVQREYLLLLGREFDYDRAHPTWVFCLVILGSLEVYSLQAGDKDNR
jgi:hypothetical protein